MADLIVRLARANGRTHSKNKRHLRGFAKLSDQEILDPENAVRTAFSMETM